MNEAVSGLVTAIESGRTDIVRCAITTLEKDDGEETDDIKLDDVLNSLLTPAGTLLHLAAQLGQADICRTLLAGGADPGVHNKQEQTPLDIASTQKVKEVFNEQLLQSVAKSNIGSICQLIAAGVDVNLQDTPHSANTPLHWAASYANKDVIHCLIKRGGSVNTLNKYGASPLHDAVSRGDMEVIEELLIWGANPHLTATEGKYNGVSALTAAADQEEIIVLINKYKDHKVLNGFLENNEPCTENGTISQIMNTEAMQEHSTPRTPTTPNGVLRLNMDNDPLRRSSSVDSSSLASPALSAASNTSHVSVVTDTRLHLLWPQPTKLIQKQGHPFRPQGSLMVYISDPLKKGLCHEMMDLWQIHDYSLSCLDLSLHMESHTAGLPDDQGHVLCQVNQNLFSQPQSYKLTIDTKTVRLDASDLSGLQYGVTTFLQLLKMCHMDGIPPLQIRDHPSLRDRGVLLDMSKGRVLTVPSFRNLILMLAHLKINQVQLYTRFLVPKDPEVKWQFSYTRSTLLDLDRFARSLGITLVPVVDVLPEVIFDDLTDVYSSFEQYISCFTSTSILGVGPRLSSFLMDLSEDGQLTSDDTRRLLPVPANHTVQLCAYMFHDATAALEQFPGNTVLAEYGFQANYDFAGHCKKYEESGVPFCVVPGTAAWNSLAGCPEAAVSNIHSAVQTAVTSGALGVIVSHWSGIGHMTHHPMCLTGLVTLAGLAWNSSVHLDFMHANLADLLNVHILEDQAGIAGQVVLELGRAETYVLRCSRNQAGSDNSKLPSEKGSTLYQLLSHPDDVSLEHLAPEIFQKSMRHVRKCQSELGKAKLRCPDGDIIITELQLTADFMLSASRIGRALLHMGKNPIASSGYKAINPGIANLVATSRTDLANRLLSHIEVYRHVWLRRNLPQGLSDSLLLFSNLLKQLIPEGAPSKD